MALGDRKRMGVQMQRQSASPTCDTSDTRRQGKRWGNVGKGTRRSFGSLPGERCCMEYKPFSKGEKLRYKERVNCLSAREKQEQMNKTSHVGLLASFSNLCSPGPKQSACHIKLNILPWKSCSCRA